MAVARARQAVAAPAAAGPNFLDNDWFSTGGGFDLPPGVWTLFHTLTYGGLIKKDGTEAPNSKALRCEITAYMCHEDGTLVQDAEGGLTVHEVKIGLGRKAHESWMPNPETGKSLVPVPGGKAQPSSVLSNFGLYIKSLYDSGLPKGTATNDISAIDGIIVRTENQDAPEERKSISTRRASTGEIGEEEQKRADSKVLTVVELLENGKPWEGTGYALDADGALVFQGEAAAPAPKSAAVAAKAPAARAASGAAKSTAAAPRIAAKAAPAPVEEAAEEAVDDESYAEIAEAALAKAIADTKAPVTKGKVKMAAYAAVGDETLASAITDLFWATDDKLNLALGKLGMKLGGPANTQVLKA
jgi:hypothetical protein